MHQHNLNNPQPQQAYLCINRHGNIISVAPSIQAILGFDPEVLCGQHLNDLCFDTNTLAYLNDMMLLKGYVKNLRLCMPHQDGHIALFDCCAAKLQSAEGHHMGFELLLTTLVQHTPYESCAQLKVSMHANILHANDAASCILARWQCQQGQALPQFLAANTFKAWTTGQISTTEYDVDQAHIYIFVPQTKRSLITLHILSKVGEKHAEITSLTRSEHAMQHLDITAKPAITHV